MPKSALFMGRFQPFHLGHLSVIKKILTTHEHLIIMIGSSEVNNLPENPFTASERYQLIQAALDEHQISRDRYAIIPVPNINNYALWPFYLIQTLPPFDEIFTGSAIVKELFEQANQALKTPLKINFLKKDLKISASKIRELMLKSGDWESLVPKATWKLLHEWGTGIKNI